MIFEILVAAFIILIPLLIWRFERNELHRIVNKIPGPYSMPLVGNIREMSVDGPEFLNIVDGAARDYYDDGVFRFWVGPNPIVVAAKPDTVEVLLNSSKHMTKSDMYVFLHPWLGTGLLTSDGDKWRSRRKLLTPAFHFKILTSFCDVFNEQAKVLVSRLSEVADGRVTNIFPYVTFCTLDVICDTAMGCHVGSQTNSNSPYVQAVKTVSDITMKRMKSFWLYTDLLFYNLPAGHEYKRCLNVMHDFTDRVIKERSQQMEIAEASKEGRQSLTKELEKDGDALVGGKRRLALLDLLLYTRIHDNSGMTDTDIREEVDTFMFEGHDTTASGVSSALYLIGRHPEVQTRLQEELHSIFGDSDRDITMDDLKELKYLEMVIKETLRLYPPVPWFARTTTEHCKIGKFEVPKDVTVLINVWSLHRRSEIFPDPDQFKPERWAEEGAAHDRHPYSYIPFSAGFRNCIGQKFAMNEEKVVIATILRKFTLESTQEPSKLRLLTNLILRPEDGVFIKLCKRTH